MNQLQQRNLYTSDYLGAPPRWLTRWGNLLMLVLFLVILGFSTVIGYNDIISAPVVISTVNPPIDVAANKGGQIAEIAVNPGEMIVEGQLLAVMENTANQDDVFEIKEKLQTKFQNIRNIQQLSEVFPNRYQLGDIQPAYSSFLSSFRDLINFSLLRKNERLEGILRRQQRNKTTAISNQQHILELAQRNLVIAEKKFDRQEKLYEKGVISMAELEKFETTLLGAQEKVEQNILQLSALQIESTDLETSLVGSGIDRIELDVRMKAALTESYQELLYSIEQWTEVNVMYAPVSGKVSIFDIWRSHQTVEKGEHIFTIVPFDKGAYLGKVQIPIRNSGKVKAGQRVIIKLSNFPYEEWGSLTGKISHISEVPKKGDSAHYTTYLDIDDLITSHGFDISFKQDMMGNAEIILEEISVFQRIFYQFRKVWD